MELNRHISYSSYISPRSASTTPYFAEPLWKNWRGLWTASSQNKLAQYSPIITCKCTQNFSLCCCQTHSCVAKRSYSNKPLVHSSQFAHTGKVDMYIYIIICHHKNVNTKKRILYIFFLPSFTAPYSYVTQWGILVQGFVCTSFKPDCNYSEMKVWCVCTCLYCSVLLSR